MPSAQKETQPAHYLVETEKDCKEVRILFRQREDGSYIIARSHDSSLDIFTRPAIPKEELERRRFFKALGSTEKELDFYQINPLVYSAWPERQITSLTRRIPGSHVRFGITDTGEVKFEGVELDPNLSSEAQAKELNGFVDELRRLALAPVELHGLPQWISEISLN